MMLTFEPLPREYLSAQARRRRIRRRDSRIFASAGAVLEHSDLHYVCVLRFDEKLRQLTGEQFVELLAERFGASAVVVGQDFRFGRGGAGSVTLLRAAADAGRFALELVPSVCVDDVRVSSSGVRAALARGDFQRGARLVRARLFDARARGRGRAARPPARISRRRTSACGAASCR